MDYLSQKILEAFKNPIIGDYLFSENELASINRRVSQFLSIIASERGSLVNEYYDELIFVAIVNAIKNWDAGSESLLDFIGRVFLGENKMPQKIYTYITNVINRLEVKDKIYVLNCFKKKYYATLISHAFAPIKSTESFFELCWKIYCDDLNQIYTKNDDVFGLLAFQLQSRFAKESDIDENFNLGSQVYHLRAGIKGLAVDKPDMMTTLIENTIGLIDKVFRGELVDKETHYFNRLIIDWWKRKEALLGVEAQKSKSSKERVVSDYRLIKPRYSIIDGTVVLELAPFRLQSDFDIPPCLTVFEDSKKIDSFELPTKGSGLLMATKHFLVPIDELAINSLNLSVEITHCQKTLFSSKKSMYRPFVLFKDGREVFSQNCAPGNYHLYVHDIQLMSQYPEEIRRINGKHFVFTAIEGDQLQSKEKTIFFETSITKREIWLYANKRSDIVYRYDGNDYEVIDGDVFIVAAPETNISEFGVRYNGAQFQLSDFEQEEKADGTYFSITAILKPGEPQSISAFKYSSNQIVGTINIVKFININIEFDNDVYYDSSTAGIVRFRTDNFDSLETFSIEDQEILVPVSNGDIVLSPPVFSWAIDNKEKHFGYFENGLWYGDLNDSSFLTVSIPVNCTGQLLLSTGQAVAKNADNTYKIGQTLFSLSVSQQSPIELRFRLESTTESQLIPITKVFFTESFKIAPLFIFAQNQLIWNPREGFIGPLDASFRIDIIGKLEQKVSTNVTLKPQNFVLSGLEEGYYRIQVAYNVPGIIKKDKILFSKEICIGNEKNIQYKDVVLKVNKAKIQGNPIPVDIKPFCIEKLRYVETRDGFDFYTGTAFIDTWKSGKIYLNKMQNDNGGFDFVNPIRIEMKDKNSCWIVYGLDDEDDIGSFTSEFSYDPSKNRISVSDKNTKGVIYYEFEKGKANV